MLTHPTNYLTNSVCALKAKTCLTRQVLKRKKSWRKFVSGFWQDHQRAIYCHTHFIPHSIFCRFQHPNSACIIAHTRCSIGSPLIIASILDFLATKKNMWASVTHPKAADEKPNVTLGRPTSRSAGTLAKAVRIRASHSFMAILRPEMICINTSGPLHPKLPPTIGVPHKDGPAPGNNK